MILQKSFYYADLLLKKHFLSMLKTVVQLNIFVKTMIPVLFSRIIWCIESSKELHLFEEILLKKTKQYI